MWLCHRPEPQWTLMSLPSGADANIVGLKVAAADLSLRLDHGPLPGRLLVQGPDAFCSVAPQSPGPVTA